MKECLKCKFCYEDYVEVCLHDQSALAATIAGSTTISGRYLLERRLGQGGMGIVFRAKHKFLKSSHAIKIILPNLVETDQDLLVRFNQEAVLAASIDHPNVIRVTDFGVENDIMPFLVMEYIDGDALSSFLDDGKKLGREQAFGLFFPVAEGVAEAHSKGIVHRDLKPQNVMVQKGLPLRKAVKVLDFGLAKIKSAESYPSLVQAKTMNIVGSPPYMSPEQWSGEGVDHRTDIYALSVILFQMLIGRLPFMADSMPAMMYQHLTVPPPTAASLGATLEPELEAILHKGLEKDPKNRYESMNVMVGDLHAVLGRQSLPALTGAATEYMIPRSSLEGIIPKTADAAPLSDSEKERFYSYFDTKQQPIADPKLAHDFLDAQDRIESAKTEAVNANELVKEFAKAQKEAEKAQDKAIQAKQQIEADVQLKVEAEMKRLAAEDQTKREAEAEKLAREVDARRAAEERANYLAQAALEAQKLAESERKKREDESKQRELQQGVREKAEVEAQVLAKQVAEARSEYEKAKKEAEREATIRAELELKQKRIESEIEILTYNEAERRKLVEAKAKEQIEEQAARYEADALAARDRLDEAQLLIDQEAEKRRQAEAARVDAENEAARLSQEIVEVQRQMEEMRQHITTDPVSHSYPGGPMRDTPPGIPSMTQRSGQHSVEIPAQLLNTNEISNRKPMIAAVAIGLFSLLLLGGGGIGLYFLFGRSAPAANTSNTNATPSNVGNISNSTKPVIEKRAMASLDGGNFLMGRNEIDDKADILWGNQFPANDTRVGAFMIDLHETTNAEYAKFVEEADRKPPANWTNGKFPAGQENHPVTNVSLIDARAYAVWVTKQTGERCRLPSEEEWEYAARNGDQATSFPWGTDWRPGTAHLEGGSTVAVGTKGDKTSVGSIVDMLGNVSEWTSTRYALYRGHPVSQTSEKFVVRGLNFRSDKKYFTKTNLLVTVRNPVAEDKSADYLGFRLVCE